MVRVPWRKTGSARRIHDELLAEAGRGKVVALYESWGYEKISEQQPSPDGPVLTAMLRDIR
ncbi:hypothetical protein ACIHFE_33690 [Streptomyces sp. NPDC052396]|uniref:hypothetical protein n=1 Tax=Streptomyces sp. NPDC052396 TaxID=3365689 RepID=UPI0037CF57C4